MIATGSRWTAREGVYLSEDGGRSWRQTLENAWFMGDGPHRADGAVLARSPAAAGILLAGSIGDGVYRSEDGGRSWNIVGLKDIYPTAIVFDRRDPRHVWLCAASRPAMSAWGGKVAFTGGLYESRDTGRTWKRVAAEAPREFVQDPVAPTRLYGIFNREQIQRSDDDGRTWSPCSKGLPAVREKSNPRDGGLFRALATGPDFVLAGAANGTIYRLDRTREQWEPVERGSVDVGDWFAPSVEPMSRRFGAAMGYIAVDPRDPRHWCFTDWYALYQSFDSGHRWRLTIDGIEATVIHVVRGSPANPELVHLGMGDNGYFRSTDGGRTFHVQPRRIGNNVKDIAVSPANANRLYAVGPATFGWHANQVFVSDNGGLSWRRSAMQGLPDMSSRRSNSIVAGTGAADDVWLAVSGPVTSDGGGVYHSADGGERWQWVGWGLPVEEPFFRESIWTVGRELAVGRDGVLLCASHAKGKVFRLDGSSGTWQACMPPSGGRPQDLMSGLADGTFYLAMCEGGLLVTGDHGRTWTRLCDKNVHHIAVDARHPGRLAAATSNGVILSDDNGRTWRELDKSLPYRVTRLPLCFAGDHLVVGTAGSGVFWLPLGQTAGER